MNGHTYPSTQRNLRRAFAWISGVAVPVALIALLWRVSAYYLGTHAARAAYFSTTSVATVVAPAAVIIVAAIVAFRSFDRIESPASASEIETIETRIARGDGHYRDYDQRRLDELKRRGTRNGLHKTVAILAVFASLVSVFWLVQGIRWMNRSGYETTAPYTANLAEVVNAETPSYETRLAIPQARLQLRQALSGATGAIGDVAYIGNGPNGAEYCATVLRASTLGRVWTRQILCLDPATGATRSADFDGNVGAPNGAWSSKLGDQVASVKRGLVFNEDDVYGYITGDGKARLVVPVRVATGEWNRRYDVAAGVVVFNHDGTREYISDVEPGSIPGPVMAMNVAERVRGSVNALEGFLVHRNPRRSEQTLERTDAAEGLAATDPNAENPSEFVLVRNGRLYYVTPLTPYGQSQTIVAYLEVEADTVLAGEQPNATLYRLGQPQASLQLIVQRVTSLYDADIDWMEANEATDASNRARIYEITPSADGHVTMTIGTGTQTLYRVYVDANLDDQNRFGDICIHRFRDDEKIRCDSADSDPTPVGALRGIASNATPANTPSTTTDSSGIDLSNVPTQDLLDEIGRRIDG